MLSKAPPVPQLSDSPAPKEDNSHAKAEGCSHAELEGQATTPGDEPMNQPTSGEQPQLIPANAGGNYLEEEQPSREPPARASGNQQQQQQMRGQRPADDRLFTLAAVGLALAIMVLLLKKFIKSSGHGALFVDGS